MQIYINSIYKETGQCMYALSVFFNGKFHYIEVVNVLNQPAYFHAKEKTGKFSHLFKYFLPSSLKFLLENHWIDIFEI